MYDNKLNEVDRKKKQSIWSIHISFTYCPSESAQVVKQPDYDGFTCMSYFSWSKSHRDTSLRNEDGRTCKNSDDSGVVAVVSLWSAATVSLDAFKCSQHHIFLIWLQRKRTTIILTKTKEVAERNEELVHLQYCWSCSRLSGSQLWFQRCWCGTAAVMQPHSCGFLQF